MESSVIRGDVLDFAQACERLAGFVRAQNGLTTLERDTIINSVRALEGEMSTFIPEVPQEALLATPLSKSNLSPID
jgi:hypothetical protein